MDNANKNKSDDSANVTSHRTIIYDNDDDNYVHAFITLYSQLIRQTQITLVYLVWGDVNNGW